MDTFSQPRAYDAFGDVAVAARPRVSSTKRARKVTVAVFWSIAVLLIAGRIYQSDVGVVRQAHIMALAAR